MTQGFDGVPFFLIISKHLMPRKKKKSQSRPVTSLPDWRDDWLYELVLRDAQETWTRREREIQRFGDAEECRYWKYVMVEEYGDSEDSSCRGDILRAWVVNDSGLSEISLNEHRLHRK